MKIPRLAVLSISLTSLLLIAAAPATAQWVWKDEANRTVISDQPPPTSVPLKNILKTPRGNSLAPRQTDSAADAGAAPAKTDAKKDEGPKTYAEKDMEFKKRQKEAAEASKKQEEEAAKTTAKQERCKALRSNQAGLESGIRIARTNEKGEREFMTDEQRQAEIQRNRTELAGC